MEKKKLARILGTIFIVLLWIICIMIGVLIVMDMIGMTVGRVLGTWIICITIGVLLVMHMIGMLLKYFFGEEDEDSN